MNDAPPPAMVDAIATLHQSLLPESDVSDQVARQCDITFCFDGGGTAILVGTHVYLRTSFPARISGWAILSDVTGSVSFAVKACLYSAFPTLVSIVAAAPPAMTTARKATGSIPEVSTWTDVVPRDTTFEAIVDSISGGIQVMTLSIRAKRLDL